MVELDSGLIIGLLIMLLALFPSFLLILQYNKYRIHESLMFAGYFFIGATTLIIHTLAVVMDSLILIKLTYIGFNCTYFFLFVYAIMVRWDFRVKTNKPPKLIWYTGLVWFIVLNTIIMFWTRFAQPRTTSFYFLVIPRVQRVFSVSNGAGYKINDFILYSSHYDYLSLLFSVYVQLLLLYTYFTLDLIQPTVRTVRVRKFWLVAFSFGLIFSLLSLPYLSTTEFVARIFTFLGMIIVIYICLWVPEGLLLSKAQLLRATGLYEKLIETGEGKIKPNPKETSEFLFNYLLAALKIIKETDREYVPS